MEKEILNKIITKFKDDIVLTSDYTLSNGFDYKLIICETEIDITKEERNFIVDKLESAKKDNKTIDGDYRAM